MPDIKPYSVADSIGANSLKLFPDLPEVQASGVERVSLGIPDGDQIAFDKILSTVDDPVAAAAMAERWRATEPLGHFYPGLTRAQLYDRFDELAFDIYGRTPKATETLAKVFTDSWEAGWLGVANGKLNNYIANAVIVGADPDEQVALQFIQGQGLKTVNIKEQIAINQKAIDELNADNAPQSALRTFVKWLGGTAPSVVQASLEALEAGMAGAAAGAVAGGATAAAHSFGMTSNVPAARGAEAIGRKLVTSGLVDPVKFAGTTISKGTYLNALTLDKMVTQAITFNEGLETLRGNSYAEMVERGVEPQVAAFMSLPDGIVQQAIEQALGIEAGLSRAFSKADIGTLTGRIVAKWHASGSLQPVGLFVQREIIGSLSDAGEEAGQAVFGGLFTYLAQELNWALEKQGIVDPVTVASVIRNAGENALAALVTSPILGIGGAAVETIQDMKAAKRLVEAAPTMSKEAFVAAAMDSEAFKPGASEGSKRAAAEEMFNARMAREKDVILAAKEKAKRKATEDQAEASRLATGALRIEQRVVETEEGSHRSEYNVVATQAEENGKAQVYGTIELTVDDNAGTVTIEGSEFMPEHEGLVDEALQDILSDPAYEGMTIQVGDTADQVVEGAVERAIRMNPRGEEANPRWADVGETQADAAAKNRFRMNLGATGKVSTQQREAVIWSMQKFANAAGVPFSKFWSPFRGFEMGNAEEIAARGKVGATAFFDIDGRQLEIEDVAKMAQSVAYLAENSNFAVVAHEAAHVGFVQLKVLAPDAVKAFEASYGVKDGKWTGKEWERAVNDLMGYMAEGKVVDEAQRPVLERIAAWLRDLWKGALEKLDLAPEVRAEFDRWMAAPAVKAAEEREAAAPEEAPVTKVTREARTEEELALAPAAHELALRSMQELPGISDPAARSVADERIRRLESGEWMDDPQLSAEVRLAAGVAASEEDLQVSSLAAMEAEAVKPERKPRKPKKIVEPPQGPMIESTILTEEQKKVFTSRPDDIFVITDKAIVDAVKKNALVSRPHSYTEANTMKTVSYEMMEPYGAENIKAVISVYGHPMIYAKDVTQGRDGKKYTLVEPLTGLRASFPMMADKFKGNMSADALVSLVAESYKIIGIDKAKLDTAIEKSITRTGEAREAAVKAGNIDPRLLFMSADELRNDAKRFEEQVSQEAQAYATWEEWVKALGLEPSKLSDGDRRWYRERHAWKTSGKAARYPNRGDFTRFIAVRKNLSDFLHALDRAANPRKEQRNEEDRLRTRRVRDAISKSPDLTRAMDELTGKGRMPNQQETERLLRYIKSNESAVKFLYAEVSGDVDLGNEALSEMERMPEADIRRFVTRPGRAIGDWNATVRLLKDDELVERARKGEATYGDLYRYGQVVRKNYKAKLDEEAKAESSDMKASYREALSSARKESKLNAKLIREQYRERAALAKMMQYMRKLRDYIMRDPGSRVENTRLQAVRFIQEYIAGGGKADPAEMRSLASIVFAEHPEYVRTLMEVVDSVSRKPFKEWTLSELEHMAKVVESLTRTGRAMFREEELARGIRANDIRHTLIEGMRQSRYHIDPPAVGESEKWHDIREKADKRFRWMAAMMPHSFLRLLDPSGRMEDFIMREGSRHTGEKYTQYDRRIDKVVRFLQERRISDRLFRQVVVKGVGADGADAEMRANELLGIRLLIGTKERYNQRQREAVIYGTFFSDREKDTGGDQYRRGLQEHPANDYMRGLYDAKLSTLLEACDTMLTDDEKALGDLMLAALNDSKDWTRFAKAILQITGREMKKESNYFTIQRLGQLGVGDDEIADGLVKSGIAPAFLETGVTMQRKDNIAPRDQRPVKLDSMRIFFDTVERQEHLANVGPWAMQAKMVFSNATFSPIIQEQIKVIAGEKGLSYVQDQVDAFAVPNAFRKETDGNDILSTWRGKVYTGMLAWRLSNVLMQMATSPLPFIAEAPMDLLGVAAEAWKHVSGGLKGMKEWYESIEAKSGELRHRQLDPIIAEYLNLRETQEQTRMAKLGQKGMEGLVFADRLSVAIGWEATYRRKKRELLERESDRIEAMSDKDREAFLANVEMIAKERADEVVRTTQPTSERAFRAPMYRDMDSFKSLVLQFTQPLNVIWNNVRYDVPDAIREREFMRAVGLVTAYALSGLAIGAVKVAKGRGPEADDEDERKWAKFWAVAATSQFVESVPVVGNLLGGVTSTFIEGTPHLFSAQNIPAAEELAKAIERLALSAAKDEGLTGKDVEAIITSGFTGLGLLTGLPTLAAVNAWKFGKGIAARREE